MIYKLSDPVYNVSMIELTLFSTLVDMYIVSVKYPNILSGISLLCTNLISTDYILRKIAIVHRRNHIHREYPSVL